MVLIAGVSSIATLLFSSRAAAGAGIGDRYTDLLLLAEHDQQVLSGTRIGVGVWDLDDHYRPVLMQTAPGRSLLGPIDPGASCQLHFALGVDAGTWPDNPGIFFRVGIRQDERDTLLFQEFVGSARGEGRTWRPRTIDLPETEQGPFSILLESAHAGKTAATTTAGWSAPYITCDAEKPPPKPNLPNVILISLDTLRADHLGVYGHPGGTSTAIDSFAKEALVFEEAFTPAPWTLPAHASMFTGLYPDEHGAGHDGISAPLPEDVPTLAEILAEHGYWTIAFTAGGMMSSANGLARGFQWWTQRTRANLEHTLPGVFSAVGVPSGMPRLLLLHTYDIHGPYGYLPNLATRRASSKPTGDPEAPAWKRLKAIEYHGRYQRFHRFQGVEEALEAYDAGIRFVDRQLGRLFERLKSVDMYDRSIIIVTSDHGESLYDRGLYLGHSYSLHDEELRVPLIIRFPGATRIGRVDELVSLVDLLPLVLGELKIAPPPGISGRNPLTNGSPSGMLRGEATHTGSRYVRSSTHKWIGAPYPRKDPRSDVTPGLRDDFDYAEKFFDLAQDPAERNNLAPDAAAPDKAPPEGFAPLVKLGESSGRPGARESNHPELSRARKAELRALGYIE